MGGGLMQLVAYGAQDIYLTGNPQITFFKVVYRRHTNFSMEAIQQTLNGGLPGALTSGRQTCTISRNGDLVHDCFLEFPIGWVNVAAGGANPFTGVIDNIELEIGGQRIDKHSGTWMEAYYELTQPNSSNVGAAQTAGMVDLSTFTPFQKMSVCGGVQGNALTTTAPAYVPLQFWFNRNPGLALPLIALQYHEVKLNINYSGDDVHTTRIQPNLWCNYIYLDTDERRRFAQVSHEYLIEQVQEQSATSTATNVELNFNHPVKELVFVGTPSTAADAATVGPSTPTRPTTTNTYKLQLNGHDRFAEQRWEYFTRKQVHDYHTGNGGVLITDSIGVYSFALKPEEHQPSGTCNFSRIDNAKLMSSPAAIGGNGLTIFAVNYNVLRIMSGMGGLAYSN